MMTPEKMLERIYWQTRYIALNDLYLKGQTDNLTVNRETWDNLKSDRYRAETEVLRTVNEGK